MRLVFLALFICCTFSNIETTRHQQSVTVVTTLYKASFSHFPEEQQAKQLKLYLKRFARLLTTESNVVIFGQPQFLPFFRNNTIGKKNFVFISRSISQYRQLWFSKYLRQLFKSEKSQTGIDKKLLSYSKFSLVAQYCSEINYFNSEYIAFLDGDMNIKDFAFSDSFNAFRPKVLVQNLVRLFPSKLMIPKLAVNEFQEYFHDFFIVETSSVKSTVSLYNIVLLKFLEEKVLPKQIDLMKQMSEKYPFSVSVVTVDKRYPETIEKLSQFSKPHQPSIQHQFNRDGTLVRRIAHQKDFNNQSQLQFQKQIREYLYMLIKFNIALLSLYICWYLFKKLVKITKKVKKT